MPAGRPTSFDQQKADLILLKVSEGNVLSRAAQSAGVGKSSVYRWLSRGRRPGKADAVFRQFRERYLAAKSERLNSLERIAFGCAEGDSRYEKADGHLALKLLGKLDARRWGDDKPILQWLVREIRELRKELEVRGDGGEKSRD